MNKETQLKKLEDAFKTLKQQINSDFHIPMADEDPQLTSVILAIEKIAYHAICAITPAELKTIPIIRFAEFNPCESCNGSGIKALGISDHDQNFSGHLSEKARQVYIRKLQQVDATR